MTELLLKTRPIQSEADWAVLADLHNEVHWRNPIGPEKYKGFYDSMPEGTFYEHQLLEEGGEVVGVGILEKSFWTSTPDQYMLSAYARNGEHQIPRIEGLLRQAIDKAISMGAKELISFGRTDRPAEIDLWQRLGFSETMRYPESVLKVTQFDAAMFDDKCKAVEEQGIEILEWTEVMSRWPDWRERFWRFNEEVKHDIPFPDAFADEPFEDFLRWIDNPAVWKPDGRFVAARGDEWMAYTGIVQNDLKPEYGNTGFTGCRRDYRRMGLATAVKVRAILWARDRGITEIDTNNEQNNPMFKLNIALGFRDEFDHVSFKRTLE